MTIRLELTSPGANGPVVTEHEFTEDTLTFGRANQNSLIIPDSESVVSSRHGEMLANRRSHPQCLFLGWFQDQDWEG